MYAVVSSGGKQYRVEPGSTLTMERLATDDGTSITFDRVLLVGDGEDVTVGTPTVSGASVSGTVLGEVLGPKIIIFKFKQKAKYRRRTGHRQHLVSVRIDGITANGKTASAPEATTPAKRVRARPAKPASATSASRKPAPKRASAKSADPKASPAKKASPAAKKPAAKKPAAKKPAAKSAAARTSTAKKAAGSDTDTPNAKPLAKRRSAAAKKSEPKE